MKNPFSYLFRARDKPQNAVSAAPSFYFGMSGSGKSVSPSSAIQVSAVYACVRVIAETIAMCTKPRMKAAGKPWSTHYTVCFTTSLTLK